MTASDRDRRDRPLRGQCVLVTRPGEQSQDLRERLIELGADVLVQPGVTIGDPPDWAPVDAALARLDQFDWLVFSSSNGVRYLIGRLLQLGGKVEQLGRLDLAAIGPGTAAELARCGLHARIVPEQFRAESLADALAADAPGRRFLLARANRGRQVLPDQLAAAGAAVHQIVVYSTRDVQRLEPDVAAAIEAGRIDWITVTSSSIARAVVALLGDRLRRSKLVSISPLTSGVLRESGYEPAAEAKQYTTTGLIDAIVDASPPA